MKLDKDKAAIAISLLALLVSVATPFVSYRWLNQVERDDRDRKQLIAWVTDGGGGGSSDYGIGDVILRLAQSGERSIFRTLRGAHLRQLPVERRPSQEPRLDLLSLRESRKGEGELRIAESLKPNDPAVRKSLEILAELKRGKQQRSFRKALGSTRFPCRQSRLTNLLNPLTGP